MIYLFSRKYLLGKWSLWSGHEEDSINRFIMSLLSPYSIILNIFFEETLGMGSGCKAIPSWWVKAASFYLGNRSYTNQTKFQWTSYCGLEFLSINHNQESLRMKLFWCLWWTCYLWRWCTTISLITVCPPCSLTAESSHS